MPCARDSIVIGHQLSGPDESIDQRELIGDGREAMEFDEGKGQRARELPLAPEEDAFVWNEYVVKDGEGFHHLVSSGNRKVELISRRLMGAERTGNHS